MTKEEVEARCASVRKQRGESILIPIVDQTYYSYGFRVAFTVVVPGFIQYVNGGIMNINTFV